METVLIALGAFVLYVVAYRTYGSWLAKKVFAIDPSRTPPSVECRDGVDFVPSRRGLVFGHHFTSIAGTGPIVGPAIAVVWGWVPALVWVLAGSIVMGAVHDFGSLVISMRHKGRTVADLASDVVNPRVRLLFLLVVLIGLWIVLAVFGLVIAVIFKVYPSSVAPVWLQIPIAVGLGVWMRRGGNIAVGTIAAVVLMYATIIASALLPSTHVVVPSNITAHISDVAVWTVLLLVYVFVASVLPVQTLLQPRDYINAWQLIIAMGLLVLGVFVAHPAIVADAVQVAPAPATDGAPVPAFFPFLFVTIACGAVSGFHCLVSSGCSSRQLRSEADAQYVGYGAMLTEGFLATLVIVACVAGIGLGTGVVTTNAAGERVETLLLGREAWLHHYGTWGGDSGLPNILKPFVAGSANMMESFGLSHAVAITIMGVFVASFAATTLDSATRLQRYIIAELAGASNRNTTTTSKTGFQVRALHNRFIATGVAVVSAGVFALSDAFTAPGGLAGAGKGGLLLWPVFGATNQLLAGLALLVITVWLSKQNKPIWVTAVPMAFMLAMTGWAITLQINGFAHADGKAHLLIISSLMLAMEIWIVVEGLAVMARPRHGAPQAQLPRA